LSADRPDTPAKQCDHISLILCEMLCAATPENIITLTCPSIMVPWYGLESNPRSMAPYRPRGQCKADETSYQKLM
jgi:hypothetical protein